jgi:hypothetical protein
MMRAKRWCSDRLNARHSGPKGPVLLALLFPGLKAGASTAVRLCGTASRREPNHAVKALVRSSVTSRIPQSESFLVAWRGMRDAGESASLSFADVPRHASERHSLQTFP